MEEHERLQLGGGHVLHGLAHGGLGVRRDGGAEAVPERRLQAGQTLEKVLRVEGGWAP